MSSILDLVHIVNCSVKQVTPEGFWSAGLALTVMAVSSVIWGSWRSLTTKHEKEVVEGHDVYKLPILAASVLTGLYVLFKYLKNDIVALLLQLYIVTISAISLHSVFKEPLTRFFRTVGPQYSFKKKIPFKKDVIKFTTVDLAIIFDSIVLGMTYMVTNNWIINNIFGLSICVKTIELLHLSSVKVGALLLIALFFYDIYFVYFTDVMVTVAMSLDAPIKFLFPKIWGKGSSLKFSALGLGDIILPGIYVALLLKFDAYLDGEEIMHSKKRGFRKKYFTVGVISYTAGLLITMIVLWVWKTAQPALLFLVPMVIIPPFLVALASGDFNELYQFKIDEEEDGDGQAAGGEDTQNGKKTPTRKRPMRRNMHRNDTPMPEEMVQRLNEARKRSNKKNS